MMILISSGSPFETYTSIDQVFGQQLPKSKAGYGRQIVARMKVMFFDRELTMRLPGRF